MLPREKMEKLGLNEMSIHELISIILSRGTKSESVFHISQKIIEQFEIEALIHEVNPKNLQTRFKINRNHSMQLIAALELGRRLLIKPVSHQYINSSRDLYEITKSMSEYKKEYVRGIYIDTRYKVIHDEILSIGSLDANIIHPREIFKPAISNSAYALFIIHNHPSGNSEPSLEDKFITHELVKIGELLQIPLFDHIVIGKNTYFSFKEARILNSNYQVSSDQTLN